MYYVIVLYNRGTKFRKEFRDVHGLPIQLYGFYTATVSAATRKSVIKLLGMHKPIILSRSLNKNYIFYVKEKDKILKLNQTLKLRILIATLAFEMGNDCPNI